MLRGSFTQFLECKRIHTHATQRSNNDLMQMDLTIRQIFGSFLVFI